MYDRVDFLSADYLLRHNSDLPYSHSHGTPHVICRTYLQKTAVPSHDEPRSLTTSISANLLRVKLLLLYDWTKIRSNSCTKLFISTSPQNTTLITFGIHFFRNFQSIGVCEVGVCWRYGKNKTVLAADELHHHAADLYLDIGRLITDWDLRHAGEVDQRQVQHCNRDVKTTTGCPNKMYIFKVCNSRM